MHRIDHATRLVDGNGAGKDGFTEGEPGVTPATIVTDDILNAVQEEIARAIEARGVALNKPLNTQLKTTIADPLTVLEGRFDEDGIVLLPAPVSVNRYLHGRSFARVVEADWVRLDASGGWESRTNRAPGYWDLTDLIQRYDTILHARVLVNPGVARAAGNRMQALLRSSTYGALGAPAITQTEQASAYDDESTDLQWIDIDVSGAPLSIGAGQTWELALICGHDANSNYDSVHAALLQLTGQAIRP